MILFNISLHFQIVFVEQCEELMNYMKATLVLWMNREDIKLKILVII